MSLTGDAELIEFVRSRLAGTVADACALDEVLAKSLRYFQCVVGTIHRLNSTTQMLELVCHRGVPDAIMDRVRVIPIGKGMAGLAAERREAVQVCNLQTDDSGKAKPGAKLTEMQGSIAAPILVGEALRGTIGVAMPRPHEFSVEEQQLLLRIGAIIGESW
ncbi:MAG: GAF domain-containing protein [Phycisphaerae bacterium]|nr:GAF domain-containing protein [Phycisphaerae bacterium]